MKRSRPLWRIRHELFWSELFARLAGRERDDEPPRYELHADFARLYFELEDAYRRRGEDRRAEHARMRALFHQAYGAPPDPYVPPPEAATMLPLEAVEYHRTDARGKVAPA